MKILKEFQVGSQYFFKSFPDFHPHDNDVVQFVDSGEPEFSFIKQVSNGNCLFQVTRHTNDVLIDYALSKGPAMQVGKFLVPEIIEFLGFTFDDLKRLKPLIDRLDKLHQYEKIIYDSYFENQGFYLTEEQLSAAYQSYKQARLEQHCK